MINKIKILMGFTQLTIFDSRTALQRRMLRRHVTSNRNDYIDDSKRPSTTPAIQPGIRSLPPADDRTGTTNDRTRRTLRSSVFSQLGSRNWITQLIDVTDGRIQINRLTLGQHLNVPNDSDLYHSLNKLHQYEQLTESTLSGS